MWSLAELGRWLERQAISVADLDERVVETFLTERRRRRGGLHRSDTATCRLFLEYLRSKGIVSPRKSRCAESALDGLTRRYETYSKRERGLEQATVDAYRPFVHRLLVERFRDEPLRLEILDPSDISSFVQRHAHSMSPKRAQLMVSALRSFFRFLLQQGEIATDLAACVPAVADWRLSTVPKYLGAEEVERLLSACDQRTRIGRRDYAILMLLARLGLRASEVVGLELDDLDWRAGEIVVRGKGQRHDRLPLLQDGGRGPGHLPAPGPSLRLDAPCLRPHEGADPWLRGPSDDQYDRAPSATARRSQGARQGGCRPPAAPQLGDRDAASRGVDDRDCRGLAAPDPVHDGNLRQGGHRWPALACATLAGERR